MQEDILVVDEAFSNSWKTGLFVCSGLAIVAFVLFWNLEDVLWAGILRLISFLFLAGAIFCLLKVMEGKRSIRLKIKGEKLTVCYIKQQKILQQEDFDLDSIQNIHAVSPTLSLPLFEYKIPSNRAVTYTINFKDSDRQVYLFTFAGKALSVLPDSHRRLSNFFREHQISLQRHSKS